jgi:hypothetical protein
MEKGIINSEIFDNPQEFLFSGFDVCTSNSTHRLKYTNKNFTYNPNHQEITITVFSANKFKLFKKLYESRTKFNIQINHLVFYGCFFKNINFSTGRITDEISLEMKIICDYFKDIYDEKEQKLELEELIIEETKDEPEWMFDFARDYKKMVKSGLF